MKTLLSMFEVERVHSVMNHLNATQLEGACNRAGASVRIRIEKDETDNNLYAYIAIQHNNYDNKRVEGYIALYNMPDRICRYAWKLLGLYLEDYCETPSEQK